MTGRAVIPASSVAIRKRCTVGLYGRAVQFDGGRAGQYAVVELDRVVNIRFAVNVQRGGGFGSDVRIIDPVNALVSSYQLCFYLCWL